MFFISNSKNTIGIIKIVYAMCRLVLLFSFQVLELEQEDLLEQYHMKASDIYYGLSPKEVGRFAYTYAVACSRKITQSWTELQKTLRMTRLNKNFFGIILLLTSVNILRVPNKAKNLKSKLKLKSISLPPSVMKQVEVDICNLPEVDGYLHVIVLIDYLSETDQRQISSNYRSIFVRDDVSARVL